MTRNLTPRDISVIRLVVDGRTNKEIAFELGLTIGTIKVYVTQILHKLEMRNRVELAVWAAPWLRNRN